MPVELNKKGEGGGGGRRGCADLDPRWTGCVPALSLPVLRPWPALPASPLCAYALSGVAPGRRSPAPSEHTWNVALHRNPWEVTTQSHRTSQLNCSHSKRWSCVLWRMFPCGINCLFHAHTATQVCRVLFYSRINFYSAQSFDHETGSTNKHTYAKFERPHWTGRQQ